MIAEPEPIAGSRGMKAAAACAIAVSPAAPSLWPPTVPRATNTTSTYTATVTARLMKIALGMLRSGSSISSLTVVIRS
jgi:hypothetical protein